MFGFLDKSSFNGLQGVNKKYLFISFNFRSICIDQAIQELYEDAEIEVVILDKRQVKNLRWTLWRLKARRYHAVLIDLPFKYLYKQCSTLKNLPRLLFYEEDACQDRIASSRWCGKFTKFYLQLGRPTLLLTGHATALHFQGKGLPAHYVGKGFDSILLANENDVRDIPLAFIGRVRSTVYSQREEMLELAGEILNCQLLRTTSVQEYKAILNRIDVFFSADVGLGEYMAKNFEALACGCILLAYRQGGIEESELGFVDRQNCLLYEDIEDARRQLSWLRKNPQQAAAIRASGQELAVNKFTHRALGRRLVSALKSV